MKHHHKWSIQKGPKHDWLHQKVTVQLCTCHAQLLLTQFSIPVFTPLLLTDWTFRLLASTMCCTLHPATRPAGTVQQQEGSCPEPPTGRDPVPSNQRSAGWGEPWCTASSRSCGWNHTIIESTSFGDDSVYNLLQDWKLDTPTPNQVRMLTNYFHHLKINILTGFFFRALMSSAEIRLTSKRQIKCGLRLATFNPQ